MGRGAAMGLKPLPVLAPVLPSPYRPVDASWDSEEDAPGLRCGHTLTAVDGPRLILFGGGDRIDDQRLIGFTNAVHVYDVLSRKWKRYLPGGEPPSPRLAHTATAVGTKVFIQGGFGDGGHCCTDDLYVLDLSHSKFKWNRPVVKGPGPGPRYGHVMDLIAQRYLVIVSGNDGKQTLSDAWALDTSQKQYQWQRLEPEGDIPSARMYATGSARDRMLLLCGGKDGSVLPKPDAYFLREHGDGRWEWTLARGVFPSPRYNHAAVFVDARLHVSGGSLGGGKLVEGLPAISVFDTAAEFGVDQNGVVSPPRTNKSHTEFDSSLDLLKRCRHAAASVDNKIYIYGGFREGIFLDDFLGSEDTASRRGTDLDDPIKSDVRLNRRAVVVGQEPVRCSGSRVQQLPLDQFNNAGRRMSPRNLDQADAAKGLLTQEKSPVALHDKVISFLLRPRDWKPPPVSKKFFLDYNEVKELCHTAKQIFMDEPTILQLKAPVKIFGDLHGQFGDLMRLFDEFGSPSTAGDITYINYLFLGDYVDRGQHSLETIALLLALKIQNPDHVHLLRGNHEIRNINEMYGFKHECRNRMRDGISAWECFNKLFNWLPLSALIERKIICMHGGIGSINVLEEIESLQRPISMDEGSIVPMDLLWSDPTENESVKGLHPNEKRGAGVVTFGPDRVLDFCKKNKLQLIIRAHECVMDGFELFAQARLITIFSATNYCGKGNAGALLVLGRDLSVDFKSIRPPPPLESSPEQETSMQELNIQRPPTPTRGRP